jgi:hypothetical protein
VRGAYGPSPERWVLVRPDGYVAAVVGIADHGAIETDLDAVAVCPVR